MDIAAIRAALRDGLDALDFNVYPTDGSPIDPPAITIGLPTIVRPNQALGADGLTIAVKLYIPVTDPDEAVAQMDTALSTKVDGSVIDLLRGLSAPNAWRGKPRVPLADQFNLVQPEDGGSYLTATLFVELIA